MKNRRKKVVKFSEFFNEITKRTCVISSVV